MKNKKIIQFDLFSKNFSFIDFIDPDNFEQNYNNSKKNSTIFLVNNNNFYIITGKNSDIFYIFNPLQSGKEKSIRKLCSLKNNHSKGFLLNINNKILCLSGENNKKIEIYDENQNNWNEDSFKEMNIERSDFSCCVFKQKYIFAFFGYNFPTQQFLDSIEFYNLDTNQWKYLKYFNGNILKNNLENFITICYCDNEEEKIMIMGGFNSNNESNFYQLNFGNNFEDKMDSFIEKIDMKIKGNDYYDINCINKWNYLNGCCQLFENIYNNEEKKNNSLIFATFDSSFRTHIFELNNFSYDIYQFDFQ